MPQQLLTHLSAFINQQHLFDPTQKILLAVSGGVDSVVMAHLFKAAGFQTGIAHCNFQLRGEESVRDEAFVRELAASLDLHFHHIQFDTAAYVEENRVTIQVAARELR